MPTACGSTDDFPYLLTAKVITNHITSNLQKKPKCRLNSPPLCMSLAFLGVIVGTLQVQGSHLLNPSTLPGGMGKSIKKKSKTLLVEIRTV